MARHLQRELSRLEKLLLALTAVVEENLLQAVKAVETRDVELAGRVRAADNLIDQMEVDLEEECLKLLALYQPVAADLRFIVATLKINTDLERVGDLAHTIAKHAVKLAESPDLEIPVQLREMAELACELFRKSVDSMVQADVAMARNVCETDDVVDQFNKSIVKTAADKMARAPAKIKPYILLIGVARALERIGDHATNIAEDVIYMLEGDIVRHKLNK